MRTISPESVTAANALTARWAATAGSGDFVLSGAGVWPLLALLTGAAEGPARAELEAALGIPAAAAHEGGLRLLEVLGSSADLSAALGFWVRDGLPLRPEWRGSVPAGTVAPLTGQQALDDWARRYTKGLIDRFPLTVDRGTLLVLATALAADTKWRTNFQKTTLAPEDGPWRGQRTAGLTRTVPWVADIAALDTPAPVTRLVVEGAGDADVHLLLGPEQPGAVLDAGIAALAGTVSVRTGLAADGPGLTREEVYGHRQEDSLRVELPHFLVRSQHDLLDRPELFGLRAALDPTRGHFPGLSPQPLAVQQGAQNVLAEFGARGFTAAAVSAFGLRAGSARPALPPKRTTTALRVRFDRPFGFLLVHRTSGLAVVAGWIGTCPGVHSR
ncbi:serpin family protein [Nocardia harenae]|uniref:serpin family protein n=1 Tax=Nocardia harenae TaxID=358707 RepID=UPI00082CCDC8|nr:serpin family protein [Nocardia harenae]